MGARVHFVNLVSAMLPQTRWFSTRRRLYQWAGADLAPGVRINGGVVLQGSNVTIGEGTWVGRRTEIVPGSHAKVTIGARCDVSQDVLFVTGTHEIGTSSRRAGPGRSDPITVGDGCWIGARATLLGGTTLGNGVVVGAGAVVMGTFPDDVLIVGTPAHVVREL